MNNLSELKKILLDENSFKIAVDLPGTHQILITTVKSIKDNLVK